MMKMLRRTVQTIPDKRGLSLGILAAVLLWVGQAQAAVGFGTVDGIYVENGAGRIVLGDRSFRVTTDTVYRSMGGKSIPVGELEVGKSVRFRYDPKTRIVHEIEYIRPEELRERVRQP